MVAAPDTSANPRLLPRRGRGRVALLALSRRPLCAGNRRTVLVHARAVRMMRRKAATYAEIGVTTNFSFLHGASHPQEYVRQASRLGLAAVGVADRNTLAGVVRAYGELDNPDLDDRPKLLIGARLVFCD